jgi:Domain of unknown function (DUF397)
MDARVAGPRAAGRVFLRFETIVIPEPLQSRNAHKKADDLPERSSNACTESIDLFQKDHGGAMDGLNWRKSSYSGSNGGTCVELARFPGTRQIAARDSKHPNGPQHQFTTTEMAALFTAIRHGRHNLT